MKESVIATQCTARPKEFKQTVHYSQTLKLDSYKLRIKIKHDSYAFQSNAKIELWDGEKWNMIHNILGQEMRSNAAYNHNASISCFDEDRAELIRVAREILE